MLTHLSIQNYTVAEQLELEISPGMTVISGETGAGKSISLDALALTLGDRADSKAVRPGAERADIHASFDLSALPEARAWLQANDLDQPDDDDCLLRRVITTDGRSRAYINGHPTTLANLKVLGEMLIDIHSQHEHQSLLVKSTHRQLLDDFAGCSEQVAQLNRLHEQWADTQKTLNHLQLASEEAHARVQLIAYQVSELDELALGDSELSELESQQRQLANAEDVLLGTRKSLALCEGEDMEGGVLALLTQAQRSLADYIADNPRLNSAYEMLNSAFIQADEARDELQRHIDSFEADPERLEDIESRLSAIYAVARKHKVRPEQLAETHSQLRCELDELGNNDERIEQLQAAATAINAEYQQAAAKLSKKRQQASKKLTSAVVAQLARLGLSHCDFQVALRPREQQHPTLNGAEDIEFLISTISGQAPQPLIKVASGGELSRISLAIQVVTAQTSTIPTLVFDEVDVGIGGGTAEVVGNMLRELGERGQVICVTHQPQVASKGHQHLRVSKSLSDKKTTTVVEQLDAEGKVQEIARMLGGIEITERTLAHAREMLEA